MLNARVFAANEAIDVRSDDGLKYVEPKTGKLESQKLAKSQKSSKSKGEKSKKPSKSRNSPNFDAKDNKPSFLTPKVRATFNHLRLTLSKTPIFQYFDSECHI